MKTLLLFFIATFIIISCETKGDKAATGKDTAAGTATDAIAKTADAQLNERLQVYLQLNKELKFDTLMDYVYPALFKLAPREQLEGILKSFFSQPGLEVQMDSLQLVSVDPVSKFSNGEATKFVYSLIMRMKITEQQGQPALTDENRRTIVNSLKRSLSTNDVSYNDQTRYFKARALKPALAIKDNVSGNEWKFVALENNQELLSVLPADIVQKYYPAKDSTNK